MVEEQRLPSLSGVEPLGGLDELQVLMVSPHQEWLFHSFQSVVPFLQRYFNCQELPTS